MTENRFNLIDEAWIPVADAGLVSLRDIFTRKDLRALGGTPLQKIALMKLLLALEQAAFTPEDDAAWSQIGAQGMADKTLAYLEQWHDRFWLYGEKPFLQMPAVKKAVLQAYGAVMPEVASGNNTALTQFQQCPPLTDASKALLLVVNLSSCFSGKKVDNNVVLSPGYSKSASGKAGPALCYAGLLHTFLTGALLQETLWLNVLTAKTIQANATYSAGLGVAPWEEMPEGEQCAVAERLQRSLMGRLVPMARFCLLEEGGLRYVEGIVHPDYQQGSVDPSASADFSAKKTKMIWADPDRRPWRFLTAFLSFLHTHSSNQSFECIYLKTGIPRLGKTNLALFGIWSGGIRLSSNAGEQYLSGSDDMVESEITLDTRWIAGSEQAETDWFAHLQRSMLILESIAKILYGAVFSYYKAEKAGNAEKYAQSATLTYWQLAEQSFQPLVEACDGDGAEERNSLLRQLSGKAMNVFSLICPQDTARQMQTWARCRPSFNKILSQ